jgi:hypothetical protein
MQQDPKFTGGFEKDLGLELLMNPRKKQGSDVISLGSREDDKFSIHSGSIKSVPVRANVIDVGDHLDSADDGESSLSFESEQVRNPMGGAARSRPRPPPSSFTEDDDGSQIESLGLESVAKAQDSYQQPRRLSEDEIIIMKKELIYQFERLEKKGMKLPRKFTLASSLEEMKMEYERLKRDKEVDSSVKLQRRIMMAVVSGVEYMNGQFDPVGAKLDGWSDSIYENIDEYDDIFEELHEKYKGKAKMAPEVKLLMMLGGSAFMHHMTHSMFKNQLPGLDEILKQNPDLAKNLAAATSQHISQQQSGAGNLFGSLGNMFSGIFGAGNNGGGMAPQNVSPPMAQRPQPFVPQPRVNMKGPSDVDDLLKELDATNNNDRIEMMSAITESELAELADDSSSINGILMSATKKKKGKKITIDL